MTFRFNNTTNSSLWSSSLCLCLVLTFFCFLLAVQSTTIQPSPTSIITQPFPTSCVDQSDSTSLACAASLHDQFTIQNSLSTNAAYQAAINPTSGVYNLTIYPDQIDYDLITLSQPAHIRSVWLRDRIDCGSLCVVGQDFVASFPRFTGNSTYPEDLMNHHIEYDTLEPYLLGVLGFSCCFPIFLACCTFLGWALWFCIQSCNCCNTRRAKARYTSCTQWVLRIFLVLWWCCIAAIAILAIGGNHGFSYGVNTAVDGVDDAFVIVSQLLTVLDNVTEPFSTRIPVLEDAVEALGQFPTSSSASQTCYASQQTEMVSQIRLDQTIRGDTQLWLQTASFNTTYDAIEPINERVQSLWAYSDVSAGYTPTTWSANASALTSEISAITWAAITDADVVTLFDNTAQMYLQLSNLTALFTSTVASDSPQPVLLTSASNIVKSVPALYYGTDFDAIYATIVNNSGQVSDCAATSPSFASYLDSYLLFVNTTRLNMPMDLSMTEFFTGILSTLSTDETTDKWAYISAMWNQLFETTYPAVQSSWTGLQSNSIWAPLMALNCSTFATMVNITSSYAGVINTTSLGIEALGGTVQQGQDLDISVILSAMTTTDNECLAQTPIGTWTALAARVATISAFDSCLSTTASYQYECMLYLANPPDDLIFFARAYPMLAQLNIVGLTSDQVTQVQSNIEARLTSIDTGLSSWSTAETFLTDLTAVITSAWNTVQARNAVVTLSSSLQTVYSTMCLSDFSQGQVDIPDMQTLGSFLDYSASSSSSSYANLVNLQNLRTNVSTVSSAFQQLTNGVVEPYFEAGNLLVTLANNNDIVFSLTRALSTLQNLCTTSGTLDLTQYIDVPGLATALRSIQGHRSDVSSQDSSSLISTLSSANTFVESISSDVLPQIETILPLLRPFSELSYDTSSITTVPWNDSADLPTDSVSSLSNVNLALTSVASTVPTITSTLVSTTATFSSAFWDTTTSSTPSRSIPTTEFTAWNATLSAMMSIFNEYTYPTNPINYADSSFGYSPILTSNTTYVTASTNTSLVTEYRMFVLMNVLTEMRSGAYNDANSSLISVNQRLTSINSTFDKFTNYVNTWDKDRDKIKRDGLVIDETRLIIVDVFLALGMAMGLCMVIFAAFWFVKISLWFVMLLVPFCILSLLISAVHMAPSLFVSDGCDNPNNLFHLAVGSQELSTSQISGFVSAFINTTLDPIVLYEVYPYFSDCQNPPQLIQILDNITVDDISQSNELSQFASTLSTQYLTALNMSLAPSLNATLDSIGGISTELFSMAQDIQQLLSCDSVNPPVHTIVNEGLCNQALPNAAFLGSMLLFLGVCIWPGLILGCLSFQRLDRKNHINYHPVHGTNDHDDDVNSQDHQDEQEFHLSPTATNTPSPNGNDVQHIEMGEMSPSNPSQGPTVVHY